MRPVCGHEGDGQRIQGSQALSLAEHVPGPAHRCHSCCDSASSWLTSASWASPGEQERCVASRNDSLAIKAFICANTSRAVNLDYDTCPSSVGMGEIGDME